MPLEKHNLEDIGKVLIEGAESEFWELMKEGIDDELERLERVFTESLAEFKDFPASECKLKVLAYLAEKEHMKGLKDMPTDVIQMLSPSVKNEENVDVYRSQKDFLPKEDLL